MKTKSSKGVTRREFMGKSVGCAGAILTGTLARGQSQPPPKSGAAPGGKLRIATICQGGHFKSTVKENIETVMVWVNEAMRSAPDLICLPERFNSVGVSGPPGEWSEPLPGPTTDIFARLAKKFRCYIVCPIRTVDNGHSYNSAVILDRSGAICGRYHKHCPVTSSPAYSDLENGITPGLELPVFDLDFGRIGIQICFDLGFPENWKTLADQAARLVLWPSAYDGGFPLRAYAWLHHYYVVSSTRTGQSRIIDPNGEILMESTPQTPVLIRDINLDYLSCHLDFNMGIPDRIQKKYGERVQVRQWDQGSAHFLVEPMAPGITSAQLQEEFGFEPTAEYHERHRQAYRQIRQTGAAEPQKARHGNRRQYGKD